MNSLGALEPSDYHSSVVRWRNEREKELTAEDSWPSLAGLFWLDEGRNLIGTCEDAKVLLPRGPEWADTLLVSDGEVQLESGQIKEVVFAGNRFPGFVLGENGLSALKFIIDQRGKHFLVRLLDNQRPEHLGFPGLEWYPIQEHLRLEACFEPHREPIVVPIVDVLGRVRDSVSPGFAVFDWNGQKHSLIAESENPEKSLFFNFRDTTNGSSTYPAGRFLTTQGVKDGRVVLDFNRATNPMCAYTHFATCPLPPLPNRLPFAVEAGEQYLNLKNLMDQSKNV